MPSKTLKLNIAHSSEQDVSLVGILEQLDENAPTQGRPLALILHGTMGHKDYLFQKKLALQLPLDSFRFDFRGSHESGGTWKLAALEEDVEDVNVVVDHLRKEYGYEISLVVGHSRGSIVGMRWMCISEEGQRVKGFVNASGRFRMWKIKENKTHQAAFASNGYYQWDVTVARRQVKTKIYPSDIEAFASFDSSLVCRSFPATTDVLTIHGLDDKTVPPYDALIYAKIYAARERGTHDLHFIETADHNFTNHRDEVVTTICDWWNLLQHAQLKNGLWGTGVPLSRL